MRGSFSSTLLALVFGAACAGARAAKRDGKFKVALLTQRGSASARTRNCE